MERLLVNFESDISALIPSKYQTVKYAKDESPHLTETDLAYNHCERFLADEILHQYKKNIHAAQSVYLSSVADAYEKLNANYPAAKKMDLLLGTTKYTGKLTPRKDSKDYKNTRVCPVNGCETFSVKIKRHLAVMHPDLSEEQVSYACKISSVLSLNAKVKGDSSSSIKTTKDSTKNKRNHYKCTNLVNRRSNYKQCLLCSRLYKNMTAHIKEKHKISSEDKRYKYYITECQVVPSCFVVIKNGVPVKLQGSEADAVNSKLKEELKNQTDTNKKLKYLRDEMANIKKKVSESKDEATSEDLRTKLTDLDAAYRKERYKDLRSYPEKLKLWKDSFASYARNTSNSLNSEKIARAAGDVILKYIQYDQEHELNKEFLLNGKVLSEMLLLLKNRTDLVTDTKIKYISYYKSFITFLCKNPTSPEFKDDDNCEAILYDSNKFSQMETIINDYRAGLVLTKKKECGKKIQAKRQKAMNHDEFAEVSSKIKEDCEVILSDNDSGKINSYSMTDCRKARNALIAAATTRLPRRSLELMSMSLKEALNATKKNIENEDFYIIYVLHHKTSFTGEPAAIAYSHNEYKALKIYIDKIRYRFTTDDSPQSTVFAKSSASNSTLSFSNANQMLRKYKTSSGKVLSTRNARVSLTTQQRRTNPNAAQIEQFARSLSHTMDTSERYYVARELEESVVESLRRQITHNRNVSIRSQNLEVTYVRCCI